MPADGGSVMPSHHGRTKAKVCDYERRMFAKNIFSNSSIGVADGNLKILYDNLSLSLSLSLSRFSPIFGNLSARRSCQRRCGGVGRACDERRKRRSSGGWVLRSIGEINCRWVLVFLIKHKLKIEVNSINGDLDKIDTSSDLIGDPKGLFGLKQFWIILLKTHNWVLKICGIHTMKTELSLNQTGKIIRYSRSTISAYFLLSHEWWVPPWI